MDRSRVAIALASSVVVIGWGVGAFAAPPPPPPPPPTADEIVGVTGQKGASWTPPGTSTTAPASQRIYFSPTPAGKVTIIEGGAPKEVYWGGLTQDQIRGLMNTQDEQVTIEQIDDSAGATFMNSGANLKKGRYRVTYYYYRYRNALCDPTSLINGTIAVGSGLRVTAELQTLKAGVKVGDLIPLAVEASRDRVRGTLRAQSFGLTSGTGSISPYLATAAGGVTPEGIRKAVESFGVVKAVSETSAVNVSPSYLFVDAPDPSKCVAVSPG